MSLYAFIYIYFCHGEIADKRKQSGHIGVFLRGAVWYCLFCRHVKQPQEFLCVAQGKSEVRLGSFLFSRYGKQICAHFEYVNIWGRGKQFPFK